MTKRLISLQKQEEAFQAEQRALAQQPETAALDRARAEEATRRLAEIERLQAETARVAAERDKAMADAARFAAESQVQQARAIAAQSERERAERRGSAKVSQSLRTTQRLDGNRIDVSNSSWPVTQSARVR
jgi:hypothetical protein